jgi:isoleucyl-tRNA synthetase
LVFQEVLEVILRLLAPYIPYITEIAYKDFSKESVHLSAWPEFDKKIINKTLEKEFQIVLKVIEQGLAQRDKVQIGLKWPLAKAEITLNDKLSKETQEIIARQLNVKKVVLSKSKDKDSKEISIVLDTQLTPALEAEGYSREISRKVQSSRKDVGLVKDDKISLAIIATKEIINLLVKFPDSLEIIKDRVNAREIITEKIDEKKYKHRFSDKIKNQEIIILFNKL